MATKLSIILFLSITLLANSNYAFGNSSERNDYANFLIENGLSELTIPQSEDLSPSSDPVAPVPCDPYIKGIAESNFITTNLDSLLAESEVDSTKYEVFGWYPDWQVDYHNEFDFSKLNTLSHFSFEFNASSGKPKKRRSNQKANQRKVYWSNAPYLDKAEEADVKLMLTVESHNSERNHKFLSNDVAIANMLEHLSDTLASRSNQAYGVCLNFEGIYSSDSLLFVNFVELVHKKIQGVTDGKLYITLPAVDTSLPYSFNRLNKYVDKYIIMGYDYSGKFSDFPGPLSPLDSHIKGGNCLSKTLQDYSSFILPSKTILALPAYGVAWDFNINDSCNYSFVDHFTLSAINDKYWQKPLIDAYSKNAVINVRMNANTSRVIWFNNATSLYYQIQLIKQDSLAGLGVWALGYEKDCPEFWNVIDHELDNGKNDDSIKLLDNEFFTYISSIFKKGESRTALILFIIMLIVGFGMFGFIRSFFDNKIREVFMTNKVLRVCFASLLLFSVVQVFLLIDQNLFSEFHDEGKIDFHVGTSGLVGVLISGYILGILSYVLGNKWIKSKKNRLP